MTNKFMAKLAANTKLKHTSVLSESVLFNDLDMVQTHVPMINVALAGDLSGGFVPGVTALAGPSKHFKTGFAMVFAQAWFRKYQEEGVVLFYDSEFGTPKGYFDTFHIPTDRVLHTPITNIEELKFDIMNQLDNIERNDKILIIIDSIGNLASVKEVEDALKGSDKADMTRAKQFKSLFRMITPHLKLKNIPLIVINHTYQTMEMFAKTVMGGGTGPMYAADTVWFLGRQQDAEKVDGKKQLNGYKFVINVDKSRFVREKSKIIIEVDFETGVSQWSGLLEAAEEGGFVIKPKKGYYQAINPETGEMFGKPVKEDDTNNQEFWTPVLTNKMFHDWISSKYKLSSVAEDPLVASEEETEE